MLAVVFFFLQKIYLTTLYESVLRAHAVTYLQVGCLHLVVSVSLILFCKAHFKKTPHYMAAALCQR